MTGPEPVSQCEHLTMSRSLRGSDKMVWLASMYSATALRESKLEFRHESEVRLDWPRKGCADGEPGSVRHGGLQLNTKR